MRRSTRSAGWKAIARLTHLRPLAAMKIERMRIVTAAKIELTIPIPTSLSVPAAPPSFPGSFLAWSSSSVMTP